jgi:competence protein ComEC
MRRPLALVGFTYLLALVAAIQFGERFAVWGALLTFAAFAVCLAVKRLRVQKTAPVACLVACVALISFSFFTEFRAKPVWPLAGQEAQISGVICELPYEAYGRVYYMVETDAVSLAGAPQKLRLRVSASHVLAADVFDRVEARVRFYLPTGGRDGFTSRSYYAGKGVYLFASLYEYDGVQILPGDTRPPYYYALKARKALLGALQSMLPPDQAAIAGGVFLGDRWGMPEGVQEDFRAIGVSHLLAVSGLHVSIIGQCLLALFRHMRMPQKLAVLLSALGVLMFMAVTGFTPSVMRAGVMMLVYLLGLLLGKRPDSLNSLGLAVLCLTAVNPFAAGDVGLLLSFSATLGLILLSGGINASLLNRLRPAWRRAAPVRWCIGTISATLAATLFTLPVSLLTFGEISLLCVPANLLLVLPGTVMLVCSAAASLFAMVGFLQFLTMPCALFAGMIAKYMQAVARVLASLPYASVAAGHGYLLLWLSGTLVLIAAALCVRKSGKMLRLGALLSAVLLLVGVLSYQLLNGGVMRLAVLQTRSGCSAVLNWGRNSAVLSLGNTAEAVAYLRNENVGALDAVFLMDDSAESVRSAEELKKLIPASAWFYPGSASMAPSSDGGEAIPFGSNVEASLWETAQVQLARFNGRGWMMLTMGSARVLLCPNGGDAALLPEDWRNCDCLVLGAVPQRVELLSADCTIVTVEPERVPRALGRLSAKQGTVLVTAWEGDLLLDVRNGTDLRIRRN